MNNRIQQRFDRSIREAVAETKRVQERERQARMQRHIEQAAKMIPAVEKMLATGMARGVALTAEQIATLRDMLKQKKQIVGTYEQSADIFGLGVRSTPAAEPVERFNSVSPSQQA